MIPVRDGWLLRATLAAAAAAWIIAITILIGGPISFRFAGLPIRSHSAIPALAVALVATTVLLLCGFRLQAEATRWWWTFGARRAHWIAAAMAVVTIAIGVNWGTFAAGGSDSYCYLNQAELFARGDVHDAEPMAADATWPGPAESFVPAGHSLVPSAPGALSPICPAGYPALLAAARLVGGRTAMFWMTPLMGGLAVWWTFVLARRLGGASAGLFAALLLATSPIFVYQLVQPMNDVTATALWCGVLAFVVRRPAAFAKATAAKNQPGLSMLLAGLLTGAALTIRPNLLPVGVVVGVWMLTRGKAGVVFGLACIPGMLFVLLAQNAMYGSPFRSGYGDLSALFSMSHVWPNLVRYSQWVVSLHTPILLLALLAPFVPRRSTHTWLLAFAASVFACYLPYVVFEDWWYQRFVLPALPALFALAAVVITSLLARLAMPLRAVAFVVLCATVGIFYLHTAAGRNAFRLQDHEHRFPASGEFIAARLPANAAIVTNHQSGSVRFYSGRSTVGWADIETGRLAEALDFLRRHGRKPYLLFEPAEELAFRTRFAATDPLGALDWPPRVDIDRRVRIYDPDDRERYLRGELIVPERVLTKRR